MNLRYLGPVQIDHLERGSGKSMQLAEKAAQLALGDGLNILVLSPNNLSLGNLRQKFLDHTLPEDILAKNNYDLLLVGNNEVRFRSFENVDSIRGCQIDYILIEEVHKLLDWDFIESIVLSNGYCPLYGVYTWQRYIEASSDAPYPYPWPDREYVSDVDNKLLVMNIGADND